MDRPEGVPRERTAPRAAVIRLAIGRVISLTGTFAAGTALSFAIFERTGSAAWVAATMVLTFGVIGFAGPVAGAIADRFDRQRVMVIGEIGAAACWLSMAVVPDEPAILLGLAFIASALEAPFPPASSAAIPNLAGADNLSWANSLIAMGRYAGVTLGPLVGGTLLAAMGARWVFLVNGISYLVSVVLVASIRGDFSDPDRPDDEAVDEHRGIVAGVRFIRRDRVLRQVLLSFVVFLLGMAMTLVADPVLAEEFGMGAVGYGLLTSCWGGGTIVGAWLSRKVTEEKESRWMVGFSGLVALTGFGVAISPWFWLVLVWVALFGLADGPTQVVEQNLLQRRTPDRVRSRVMGAYDAAMHGALVVSLVIGGAVVPLVGPRGAYALGGVTGLLGTALLIPLLWWLPRADRREPVASAT